MSPEQIAKARKASMAIYLVCEEHVARDISGYLIEALDEVERLQLVVARIEESFMSGVKTSGVMREVAIERPLREENAKLRAENAQALIMLEEKSAALAELRAENGEIEIWLGHARSEVGWLNTENARYREALEFYATADTFRPPHVHDNGQRARAALEPK